MASSRDSSRCSLKSSCTETNPPPGSQRRETLTWRPSSSRGRTRPAVPIRGLESTNRRRSVPRALRNASTSRERHARPDLRPREAVDLEITVVAEHHTPLRVRPSAIHAACCSTRTTRTSPGGAGATSGGDGRSRSRAGARRKTQQGCPRRPPAPTTSGYRIRQNPKRARPAPDRRTRRNTRRVAQSLARTLQSSSA